VARGVDDVETVVFPETGCRRGLDGDAPLLLLVHEVRGRRAIVNLANLMDLASELEDALSCCRLARVDVSEDSDISVAC